jgi:protein-L-isoaspartate(D-aspartate) O-methyltransferase
MQADDEHGERFAQARARMVSEQLEVRGIVDPRVLEAMGRVPRERFMPGQLADVAYTDRAWPIGHDQTISQPYVVAFMCDALELKPGDRVLEIGTGSGYHAAVLAELAAEVYSIEIVAPLGEAAAAVLDELGTGVQVRIGDGYVGWPEAAPFDAILLTAAPPRVPQPLLDQLAPGGRLVAPVGSTEQELVRVVREAEGFSEERLLAVRFVPMTGRAQERR